MQLAKEKGVSIELAVSMLMTDSMTQIEERLDEIGQSLSELVELRKAAQEDQTAVEGKLIKILTEVMSRIGEGLANEEAELPPLPPGTKIIP